VHVVSAVLDPYALVSVVSVVVPFAGAGKPLWVGLGAVSLDLVAALIASSLLRRRLGARAWRAIHWTAYLCWPAAALHSVGLGSDAGSVWLQSIVVLCAAGLALAVVTRVTSRSPGKRLAPPRKRVEAGARA
jgi:sulfoxide reductase heme-binding subunit YedZ